MASDRQHLIVADLRGGRNGVDHPLTLPDQTCAEAVNVDWFGATLGRKRNGAVLQAFSGIQFLSFISSLFRHVPGTDPTAAELWATDNQVTIARVAGGTTYTNPALKDQPTGMGWDFSWASLNGKLFIAYKTAQGRLHCWDGSTVRRTGIASSAAPTAADTGAGAATGTRYYRVRFLEISGSTLLRRSEPSPSVTFTASGTGTGALVTQPTPPNEGETHWEIEVSFDNTTFYELYGFDRPNGGNPVVIGTTSATDLFATNTQALILAICPPSASIGLYSLQKSYKFIAADSNHLLGFGSWTSTDKQNTIEISAPIGSLNVGDAERVPPNSTIGLDENDSGQAMGIRGPINGIFFAFKDRQVWKLVPTTSATLPYQPIPISKVIGCVDPRAIAVGEDESGNPAIYWLSDVGPYRYGVRGLEYIGRPVEDLILAGTPNSLSVLNLAASNVVAHLLYVRDKRQVWWWFATGTSANPNTLLVFQLGRISSPVSQAVPDGWTRYTGPLANALCSTLFSNTVGASMSKDLKPYIGQVQAVNTLWKADTGTDDAGTAYQSFVITKAFAPWGFGFNGHCGINSIAAKIASATLQLSVIRDYGLETLSSTVSIAGTGGSETRTQASFPRIGIGPLGVVQFQIGDSAAISNSWVLDQFQISWKGDEVRTS